MDLLKAILFAAVVLSYIYFLVHIYKLEHIVSDTHTEDEAEKIAMFRESIADEAIATYCGATMTPRDAIEPKAYALGWDNVLVEIVETNLIVKFYFYWKTNKLIVTILDEDGKVHTIRTKIKENRIDMAKLMKFFEPYCKEMPIEDDSKPITLLYELLQQERDKCIDDNRSAYDVMLNYIWPELRGQINWRDKKQFTLMMALLASIMKMSKAQGKEITLDELFAACEDDSSEEEEGQ